MTQQFGQMGVGGQQQASQPQGHAVAQSLNRLQTTDLISQPIHVSEIDHAPPPIILPPNVCFEAPTCKIMLTFGSSRA